ncbi:shikimate kinase [soil metagenome]
MEPGVDLGAERRIILLGFMGAGKSTVGSILASLLGWTFIDLDDQIRAATGHSIARIFAEQGEQEFRRLEAEIGDRLLDRDGIVLAPGGGWVTNDRVRSKEFAGSIYVWLRVSPEEVLRRVGRSAATRPLLAVADPEAAIRRLLDEREPLYRKAHLSVETDQRKPYAVAAEIESLLKGRGSAASPC